MIKRNGLVISTLMVVSNVASATLTSYYPDSYREIFEKQSHSGKSMKAAIYEVLGKYHQKSKDGADKLVPSCINKADKSCYRQKSLDYKEARKYLFGQLHLRTDANGYYIDDIYCNKRYTKLETQIGPMIIPDSKYINCEHTWPQSRFNRDFPKGLQKGDLHHLYPTDSRANSTRGHYLFGETDGEYAHSNCTDSKIGQINTPSGRLKLFEPPQDHKGNVARATFYFSVRYKLPISATEEKFLRKWHREDPVDEEEIARNNAIEKIQFNRNPFIDFPELVESINDF